MLAAKVHRSDVLQKPEKPLQVLADATAVDDKYTNGGTITPLCGLPLAVKDSIDVSGYRTTAATPGLARKPTAT